MTTLKDTTLIIDFDSTFNQKEGLDELARISLRNRPDVDAMLATIRDITNQGMEGIITFTESLSRRLAMMKPTKTDVEQVAKVLQNSVSPSFVAHKEFIKSNADNIYVVSGGFRDFILPIVSEFGIAENHVLANSFVYASDGGVQGFDANNPLSLKGGKVLAVSGLNLKGKVVVIGDGYTDYEIKHAGLAQLYIAYTENVRRESVIEYADYVAKDFGSVLNYLG